MVAVMTAKVFSWALAAEQLADKSVLASAIAIDDDILTHVTHERRDALQNVDNLKGDEVPFGHALAAKAWLGYAERLEGVADEILSHKAMLAGIYKGMA